MVVAGHVATFLIAARTAGSTASPAQLVPLALLVLLAMAVPANVGGWGPREGVAAWAFGAAGLGAAAGVARLRWSTASWCSSPACPAPPC